VNVLCIAGFLGSGKTTVLLEVARALTEAGARVAVIENEIGEVGVDGGYVREQGLPVDYQPGCSPLKVIRMIPAQPSWAKAYRQP